ncbi:MAG TPA: cupredoxin domain-containing protein [Vicinamibacterales bacterium]
MTAARAATAAIAARVASSEKHTRQYGNTEARKLILEKYKRLSVLLCFCAAVYGFSSQDPQQNRREFTIVAKDHVFSPDRIEVSQDDLVKITLRSEDVPVSFAIDAYRIIKRVPGKTSITFEFRADQPGAFRFYCNLTTDPACKDMTGTFSVRQK